MFSLQCNGPLIFPDTLASSQFGLTVNELEQHIGNNENTLTLMGVSSGVASNVLQPIILDQTESRDDLSCHGHHSAGDKSPLPELTQLSSHSFRGKIWPGLLSPPSHLGWLHVVIHYPLMAGLCQYAGQGQARTGSLIIYGNLGNTNNY